MRRSIRPDARNGTLPRYAVPSGADSVVQGCKARLTPAACESLVSTARRAASF